MVTNLLVKPPGWRAAEGHSQPALGCPESSVTGRRQSKPRDNNP
jgi:hypothetical protein